LLVGVFSLLATVGLLVFALWLGKLQLDREYQEYDVRFRESVAGLSVGSIVQYQGIQVGEVRRLSLNPEDPAEVIARVRITANTPVKTDTRAKLSYTGLTGVAVIEFFGGTAAAPLLVDAVDALVPMIESEPSALSKLMSEGSGAVLSAQEVLARISDVLSDANVQRVSNLLANLEGVSGAVREDYPDLREAMADLRGVQDRLESAVTRADQLLAQVQAGIAPRAGASGSGDLFAEARSALADIQRAAVQLEAFSASGERTVSGIDAAARNELVATLRALQQAAENLARISRRFDQGPSGYLLGRDSLPVYEPESRR
jgi:phospholipid/cholesterol/gamma-HCH transport system substrate-binding protein